MRIEQTALIEDVKMITEAEKVSSYYRYDVILIANNVQVRALKMESLTVYRDYKNAFGDETTLEAWFVEEDVNKYILPYAKDFQVMVTRNDMTSPLAPESTIGRGLTERFDASIVGLTNPPVGQDNQQNRDQANTMKKLTLQLVDRSLNLMRSTSYIGGIFRKTTASEVIKTVFSAMCEKVTLDNAVKPLGVEMVKSDTEIDQSGNRVIREHIMIPPMPAYDAPNFIQDNCGGIYNNGLACYYQDRLWYVYPLFDNSRFDKESHTLTIVKVPPETMTDVEQSFTTIGDHLYILGTGDAIHVDNSDHAQLNQGNGALFATSSGLFNSFASASGSKALTDQSNVMGRIAVEKRPGGIDTPRFTKERITNNVAKVASRLASQQQQLLQIAWGYSDYTKIFPGMPMRLLFTENGVVNWLQGTVISTETLVQLSAPGMTTEQYFAKTVITCLVTPPPPMKA